MNKDDVFVVRTDGGSRGNPGPAASAFIIELGRSELYTESKFLGSATNNIAEYTAVLLAVNWLGKNLKKYSTDKVNFFLDSELIVKQINGTYKVKDKNLKVLYLQIVQKIKDLGLDATFKHVTRDKNFAADLLVNQELDSHS